MSKPMTVEQAKSLQAAYRNAFDRPDARRALEDLAAFCYEQQATYAPGMEMNESVFYQGRRSVILRIRFWLTTHIEKLYENGGQING